MVGVLYISEFVRKFSMCTACDTIESIYWHLEDMEFPKYFSTSDFPLALAIISNNLLLVFLPYINTLCSVLYLIMLRNSVRLNHWHEEI
jgi:hypothetical protein